MRHGLFGFDMANFCERVLILAKNGDTNFGLRISGGSLERKIGLYEGLGELEAGEELGFSLNATLSLLLPKDTRLLVGIGDEITSCALLGYFSAAQKSGAKSQISAPNSAPKAKISAKNSSQSTQISQTKNAKTSKNSTTKQSKNSASPKTNSAKTKTPKNSKSTKASLKATTKTSAKAKNSAQSPANSSKGAR